MGLYILLATVFIGSTDSCEKSLTHYSAMIVWRNSAYSYLSNMSPVICWVNFDMSLVICWVNLRVRVCTTLSCVGGRDKFMNIKFTKPIKEILKSTHIACSCHVGKKGGTMCV